MYLETTEGDLKKRYYNHNKSFRHCSYANETALSKHVWEDKYNEMPSSVPGYSNISIRCLLRLYEKFEILNYPN